MFSFLGSWFPSSNRSPVAPINPPQPISNGDSISAASDRTLAEQMKWAMSFVEILPMPVCLVDSKGFVHYTNKHFQNLIRIDCDNGLCPWAGRFMVRCEEFRHAVDTLKDSNSAQVASLKITWTTACIVDSAANTQFVWTVSGSASSAAYVIAGKLLSLQSEGDLASAERVKTPADEERIKVEKYREVLRRRATKQPTADANELSLAATNKWDKFYSRCNKAASETVPSRMSGFVDVLLTATESQKIDDDAGLK